MGQIWDIQEILMGNPSGSMEFDFSWEDHGSKMVDVRMFRCHILLPEGRV